MEKLRLIELNKDKSVTHDGISAATDGKSIAKNNKTISLNTSLEVKISIKVKSLNGKDYTEQEADLRILQSLAEAYTDIEKKLDAYFES